MKKKNVYASFIKKALLYAGLGSKQKTFSNCQATYQKEFCLLFENQVIFSQIERTDRLDTPPVPLFVLVRFLRTSLPARRTYFLNDSLL